MHEQLDEYRISETGRGLHALGVCILLPIQVFHLIEMCAHNTDAPKQYQLVALTSGSVRAALSISITGTARAPLFINIFISISLYNWHCESIAIYKYNLLLHLAL